MQKMQQVEYVPSCNTDGHKVAHLKDDNHENSSMAEAGNRPARNDILISTEALASRSDRPPVMISNAIATGPKSRIQKSGKEDLHTERNIHPDKWDDAEGYYAYRMGEALGGR